MKQLKKITERILEMRNSMPAEQSLLAGISGIDACGKGYLSSCIASELRRRGMKTALIGVDEWLNLPNMRFGCTDPGRHFYQHALRLVELFDRLILPLRRSRSIRLIADLATETSQTFRKNEYHFEDIDVIMVEGIFIFKKHFTRLFDLKVWVDCSFETALQRAIDRSQEGLGPEATIEAYDTIYFPAQRIHIETDRPDTAADVTIDSN